MPSIPKEPRSPDIPDVAPADPTNTKEMDSRQTPAPDPKEVAPNEDIPGADIPPEGVPQEQDMGGGDPMQPDEPKVELPDIIRKFELKKIHTKLRSIENFLYANNNFTTEMVRIQKNVNTAIELFNFVVENLSIYRENMDKIIDIFNKFIEQIISMLNKYSKELLKKAEKNNKNNKKDTPDKKDK
jgi:hypothetical protein